MDRRQTLDELIDRFVYQVNHSPRHRIREEDIPIGLRKGGARFGLYYSWAIQRFHRITWIEPLERLLPHPLPPSYRSLVARYLFPSFTAGPLVVLANTGQALYNEMSMAMVHDRVHSSALLQAGYAQFARPANGDYDPVCFDFNRRNSRGECPIVRIDHEDLLTRGPRTSEILAPSFRVLVEDFLREGQSQTRPLSRQA